MRRRPREREQPPTLSLNDADRELLRRVLESADADRRVLRASLEQPPVDVDTSPWKRLPPWGKVTRVATVVAVGLALLSLGYVAIQTKQSADANRVSLDAVRATALSSATTALLQFDDMFAQKDKQGTLLPHFIDRTPLPTGPKSTAQRNAFFELAFGQLDVLEGYAAISKLENVSDYFDQGAIARWRDWTFQNSPELCRFLNRVQPTYSTEFVEAALGPCGGNLTVRNKP
jgi:hypothetical protein